MFYSPSTGSPTTNPQKTRTQEVIDQVEEVKGIMQNNVSNLVRNVDNLEVLQDKTGNLLTLVFGYIIRQNMIVIIYKIFHEISCINRLNINIIFFFQKP